MPQVIWIVKGPNRLAGATLRRNGIRRLWRTYHPTAISLLQSQSGTAGSVVVGAVVGGLLLGGVGAVVGGLAGGARGRTAFVVETAEGITLTCQCKTSEFPGVQATISKMIERRRPDVPGASQGGCLRFLWRAVLVSVGLLMLLVVLAAIF